MCPFEAITSEDAAAFRRDVGLRPRAFHSAPAVLVEIVELLIREEELSEGILPP